MITTTFPYAALRLRSETFTNPRTDSGLEDTEIRELAVLIARHGLLNPLHVDRDGVILAGQRRYRAIAYLRDHTTEVAHDAGVSYVRAQDLVVRLLEGVPCIIYQDGDPEGVAMADNLGRVEMSSYEICAEIFRLHAKGDTGTSIASRIGKSPAFVSKALRAWRGASADLHVVWRTGELTYERVKELADLPRDQQAAALTGASTPRGSNGRPGIDAVKNRLDDLHREYGTRAAPKSYAAGVLDALRWVAGQQASETFAQFVGEAES